MIEDIAASCSGAEFGVLKEIVRFNRCVISFADQLGKIILIVQLYNQAKCRVIIRVSIQLAAYSKGSRKFLIADTLSACHSGNNIIFQCAKLVTKGKRGKIKAFSIFHKSVAEIVIV